MSKKPTKFQQALDDALNWQPSPAHTIDVFASEHGATYEPAKRTRRQMKADYVKAVEAGDVRLANMILDAMN